MNLVLLAHRVLPSTRRRDAGRGETAAPTLGDAPDSGYLSSKTLSAALTCAWSARTPQLSDVMPPEGWRRGSREQTHPFAFDGAFHLTAAARSQVGACRSGLG